MRGFLVLASILTSLLVWLFVASPARTEGTADHRPGTVGATR